MKNRLICAVLCLLMLLLCGCTGMVGDVDTLLSPPRPSGELYYIQQALDDSVNEIYTLKYPTSGEYRSAFVLKDVDGDSKNEAFAFYSTTVDNVVTMHVNLILKQGEEWTSVGEFKCVAAGVDSVEFSDMDGDGVLEIIVGWSIYGSVDKSVGVYTVKNGIFTQRVFESYTNFICRDIDGDKRNDLFLTYINAADKTAVAKLIALNDTGAEEIGVCQLDGNITSHSVPVVSKLLNGETAIYIDAVKGDGMITEILSLSDGNLRNVLQGLTGGAEAATYRSSTVSIRDIDADGVYEIPMLELMTQSSTGIDDDVYKTYWYAFDGSEMILKMRTVMNYADGWYITLPDKWEDRITVIRDTANRERIFMRIDEETGNSAEVVLKLRTVPVTTPIDNIVSFGFDTFEITRNDEYYFAASVNQQSLPESLTKEEVKQMFNLIN